MKKIILFEPPDSAVVKYPDTDRYKGGFAVRSQSSNNLYKMSYDTAQQCWVCSCPGNIRHGQCKHLDACGLKGRKYGKNLLEGQRYGFL